MNLSIYTPDFELSALIGNAFVSCYWRERNNDLGAFTLELQDTPYIRGKVNVGYYVVNNDTDAVMVVNSMSVEKGIVTLAGSTADRTLDDVAMIGTIKRGENIAGAINREYNKSVKFPGVAFYFLTFDKAKGQVSNTSMLDALHTVCKATDCNISTVFMTRSIVVKVSKGESRPNVVFRSEFGTLSNAAIDFSIAKLKNYAVVLGQSETEGRVRVDVDQSNGAVKRQIVIDARDLQQDEGESLEAYKERLADRGKEKLLKQLKTWAVTFEPNPADFGKKYNLGDTVTVIISEWGLVMTAKVCEYSIKEQNNESTLSITVGELTKEGN